MFEPKIVADAGNDTAIVRGQPLQLNRFRIRVFCMVAGNRFEYYIKE